ncbi:MAG: pyruvate kinase [Solirubrobacterales bacterium]|jgi:pyruvate kinase|nr:pyruvate kinase [Solirubrobacterales bacterium]
MSDAERALEARIRVRGRVDGQSSTTSRSGETLERRTKIVATLGPATDVPGVVDALVAAGVDCVRLNCSHGTSVDLLRRAGEARVAAGGAGRPLGVLFDLQGPKLRLAADTVERGVRLGEVVVLTGREAPGAADRLVVDYHGFSRLVSERSEIVIGDGVPRLAVEGTTNGEVFARVVSAGRLAPSKGVNVTFARPELPAITEKDIADVELAAEAGADFVALSFVRSGADIDELRTRLRSHHSRARIVAKIETVEAYENLDEILAAADGVMIARGDYGVTAGLARVPLMQKDTIRRATRAGKFVITATQMLESMIVAPEPTRAEVADVANAVIDGTSAVMLSAETSVGQHPVEAVRAMSMIAEAAEESPDLHHRGRRGDVDAGTPAAAVMHAAVQLADELDAAAILVPTATGGAARACSKYRPRNPIIALAHDPPVAEQLTLEWGVYPVVTDMSESLDELVDAALRVARDFAGLQTGDRIVVTNGQQPGAPGATNAIIERALP